MLGDELETDIKDALYLNSVGIFTVKTSLSPGDYTSIEPLSTKSDRGHGNIKEYYLISNWIC
jgi:hypothetical protein